MNAKATHTQDSRLVRISTVAPAKLNHLLAVGEKRPDGYHEVVTVLQTLDLADKIDIDIEFWDRSDIDVLVEAPTVPGGDTLVTASVDKLLKKARLGARVWVTIDKEIPIGAGLGGGSSNAAAVLLAINAALETPLPFEILTRIAAQIGSDVPFFLLGTGSTAIGVNRGEVIRRMPDIPTSRWLLVNPNISQSTAAVYKAYLANGAYLPKTDEEAYELACAGTKRNDLAKPARQVLPVLDKIVNAICDAGGDPLICGSGATIAVPIKNNAEQIAYEGVAKTAYPDSWMQVAQTTVKNRD